MKGIRLIAVAGVRPQYIKLSVLNNALSKWQFPERQFQSTFINLGQHYDKDLAGNIIDETGLRFEYTIEHFDKEATAIFGNIIIRLGKVLGDLDTKPDWLIVFGDANCSLAAGLVAVKHNIRVAHIEAGIRSPGTEENLNCILIDHLSSVNFASSKRCVSNLAKEGIKENVYMVGDFYYDVIKNFESKIPSGIPNSPQKKGFILVTLHHGIGSDTITTLLDSLSKYKLDTVFVYHPKYQTVIKETELKSNPKIKFLPPLSHIEMLGAIKSSSFIITDSGGIQREAYFLKKHCILLQNEAYWPELANNKIHKLAGRKINDIQKCFDWAEQVIGREYPLVNGFGDGDASNKILKHLSGL